MVLTGGTMLALLGWRLAAIAIISASCRWPWGWCYPTFMQQKISSALGSDYKDYTAFSYPTDNFGLATAYTSTDDEVTLDDADFLCDTWNCLGIVTPPTDSTKLLDLNGLAAVGAGGGITLTEEEQRSLAVNTLLPELYQVLGISGQVEDKRVTTVSLRIGSAYARKLRRIDFTKHINKLPADNALKQAYDLGTLTIVVADVVVSDMKVDVTLDQQASAAIDAKFPTGLGATTIKKAQVGVKLARTRAGSYTFDVSRPVIVRRLAKRQPRAGALEGEANDEWNDWRPVKVPTEVPTDTATTARGVPSS